MTKQNKAITLIALIITIIVLLILAGVTINMVLGENGIVNKSKGAVGKYENAQEKENATLDEYKKELEKYMGEVNLIYEGATNETIPYLPNANCSFISETSLATGLVMKDENNNEWVWIEVPKSITASSTTESQIYDALVNYIQGTTNVTDTATILSRNSNYVDTWKNEDGTINLSEVISEEKYNTNKSKMLQSIKQNGGFWIGRYEVGVANELYRTEATDATKPETAIVNFKAVIQQNAKPYTYVTPAEAEQLSEELKPRGSDVSSLMYGIQWDLILRYLYEKRETTGLSIANIKTDSKDWGNYPASIIYLNRGKYRTEISNEWNNVTVGNKTENVAVILTTGASDNTKKMNIYDIAGNISEWILSRFTNDSGAVLSAGPTELGEYGWSYMAGSMAKRSRLQVSVKIAEFFVGFRPALY